MLLADVVILGHGMPNGTLCGKAVVELMLADEQGVSPSAAHKNVTETVGLPEGYLITEERIAEARKLPPVAKADAMGTFGAHEPSDAKEEKSGIVDYLKSFIWSSKA